MPDFGRAHAAPAFEVERLCHHADGEDAHLARGLGDDGCSPGAGAAAHAGGDEHHVGAREMVAKFVDDFLCGGRADVGLGAGAETLGDLGAHLHDALGFRHRQRLRVGVGDDEVDALQPGGDHVVDGIAASATDAEHGNPRFQLADVRGGQIECHGCLSFTRAWVGPGRRPRELVKFVSAGDRSSEALAKPSSDLSKVTVSPCPKLPRMPRFDMFEMSVLRIDQEPGGHRE